MNIMPLDQYNSFEIMCRHMSIVLVSPILDICNSICSRRYFRGKIWLFYMVFLLALIFYIENISYLLNRQGWMDLKCESRKMCTKIMLVADPQLIGYNNEIYGVTPFSVFDSDRYLSKTFEYAYSFIRPDVVIFLGDLFDEGSTATDEEFKLYTQRFYKIFLRKKSHIQHIFLPGDNDIGGEGGDRVTTNKVKRFNAMFSQPDSVQFKNISFYKINRMLHTIPKLPKVLEFYNTNRLVVGLSHIPLMFIPNTFVEKVLDRMMPHVLFTAHEHVSMMISTNALLRDDRQIVPITPNTIQSQTVILGSNNIYEIIVPTCSYRMGTDKIGYGYAILENSELQYTVLWSPSRFPQLKIYLLAWIGLFLIVCYYWFKRFVY